MISHDIFSLPNLFNLVGQSLGPFMLLQMALFHSILWLSNVPVRVCVCVYVCVSHLLYPLICRWAFRLLPCIGYWKYCCYEHGGVYIFKLKFLFFLDTCPGIRLLDHMATLFLVF